MTKTLIILNDPPYGTERSYNALRLAGSLARRPGEEVKVFLMGDAASCARSGQKVPQGYYNLETMLQGPATRQGVEVGVCGTCMDARGITEAELAEGATRSSLSQLTDWTVWADKTLVFQPVAERSIYLGYNATTPVLTQVVDALAGSWRRIQSKLL